MEDGQELAYDLPNSAIFNDPERTVTQISTARH